MRDYCEDCPAHWSGSDYWGEWDEGCELHHKYCYSGEGCKLICRLPRFLKNLYLKVYRWIDYKRWEKQMQKFLDEE